MPKPRIFITRKIPESGIKLLQKSCLVKIYPKDQVIPKKELIKEVKNCDALLCLLTDKIEKEVIDVLCLNAPGKTPIECAHKAVDQWAIDDVMIFCQGAKLLRR
mgnify:CR=1 FL=1